MKQYKIYKHYLSDDYQIAKVGWNWPSFFFTIVWAVYSKLWKITFKTLAILFGSSAVLYYLISQKNPGFSYSNAELIVLIVFFIVSPIIFGYKGNKWKEEKYCFRIHTFNMDKYGIYKTVVAANEEGAWTLFNQGRTPSDSWLRVNQPVIDLYYEQQKKKEQEENG